ncbi:MAG: hypothetical protein V7704_03250 [Aurantimonas endophytica]|uniref:hypothetical protein n=1 Tax=Aurantimonas endophytica TaxID=1522175 RepID=UPI003001D871
MTETLGTVTAVTTDVLISRPAGLVPARVGAPLAAGMRVMTGPDALASLLIGRNCRVDMEPSSLVIVAVVERRLCVTSAGPGIESASPAGLTPTFPDVMGGLVAVAGAATVITGAVDDDDDTDSISRGE